MDELFLLIVKGVAIVYVELPLGSILSDKVRTLSVTMLLFKSKHAKIAVDAFCTCHKGLYN